jgi:hypothetical protein
LIRLIAVFSTQLQRILKSGVIRKHSERLLNAGKRAQGSKDALEVVELALKPIDFGL